MSQTIQLPPFRLSRTTVGRNVVEHLGQPALSLQVEAVASTDGIIRCTDEQKRVYTLIPPRRSLPPECGAYVLRSRDPFECLEDLNINSTFRWVSHPSSLWPTSAEGITQSWKDCFQLVAEDQENGLNGLREPQIGALHAIAAHWTIGETPATIVMPTGAGKTETMLAAMLHHQCARTLVIVPNRPLRDQIFAKFASLGALSKIGVISLDTPHPRVGLIRAGITKITDAKKLLKSSNVIVAGIGALSHSDPAALRTLAEGCSHLFIDEAHHQPARTWKEVRDRFSEKSILQFTATPYRRDGKRIEGKIIYEYPLERAQKANLFRPIDFCPVEELDETSAAAVIARKAIEKLKSDIESGFDHLILARVERIQDVEATVAIYAELAPELNPIGIHSKLSQAERRKRLEMLENRESRVLVCVDMFGEGFDLPQLKIAAMHNIHKTLPITLQFIGRFTRDARNVGDASVVVNIADPVVDSEIRALYSRGADWDSLLRRRSTERIAKEISLHELIDSFRGSLPKHLPLWNLSPIRSTVVYRAPVHTWNPTNFENALPGGVQRWTAVSEDKRLFVGVLARDLDIKWGKYEEIKDLKWDLVIGYWDESLGLFFVYSSDSGAVSCEALAREVIGDTALLIQGEQIFRVFGRLQRPMVRTLGASKTGAIRFTMFFGPDVTEGLSQIEKAESELNNIAGWGFENGEQVTMGCSIRKGKVWSRSGGSLIDWRDWCVEIGQKLLDDSIETAKVFEGFLRPVELESRPPLVPLTVDWGPGILTSDENRVYIHFGNEKLELSDVGLDLTEESLTEDGSIVIRLVAHDYDSRYELKIGADAERPQNYDYQLLSGPPVSISRGRGNPKSLLDYMYRDPCVIYYADGSFSYNQFFVKAPCPGEISVDHLITLDWSDTNLRKESLGQNRAEDSIQYRTFREIKDSFEIVFDDDASYEAADIIALRQDGDNNILLRLIHCKYSKSDSPSARIDNLYELCGQAQKCVRWKHAGFKKLASHMRRRDEKWQQEGYTRFLKGDRQTLRRFEKLASKCKITLEVAIVQPGLSKGMVSEDILRILGTTELYLKRTAEASLEIFCSE